MLPVVVIEKDISFQSFWVNGLLWKHCLRCKYENELEVSILLGQWITLEGK